MDGDHLCRECDGTGWVLYRSEAKDGTFEEAYRLLSQGSGAALLHGIKQRSPWPAPRDRALRARLLL